MAEPFDLIPVDILLKIVPADHALIFGISCKQNWKLLQTHAFVRSIKARKHVNTRHRLEGLQRFFDTPNFLLELNLEKEPCNNANQGLRNAGCLDICSHLSSHVFLTDLNLAYNDIGSNGMHGLSNCLKHLTALTSLDLQGNAMRPRGARRLTPGLQCCTKLVRLRLGYNCLQATGMQTLQKDLRNLKLLQTIELSGNFLQEPSVLDLYFFLEEKWNMTELVLEKNRMGPELGYALEVSKFKQLRVLNLHCTMLQATGFEYLSAGLKQCQGLTHLFLGWNNLRCLGAQYLSLVLPHIPLLQVLDISCNFIEHEGLFYLRPSLSRLVSLKKLNLERNLLENQSIPMLVVLAETVTDLNVNFNNFVTESELFHVLYQALQKKSHHLASISA